MATITLAEGFKRIYDQEFQDLLLENQHYHALRASVRELMRPGEVCLPAELDTGGWPTYGLSKDRVEIGSSGLLFCIMPPSRESKMKTPANEEMVTALAGHLNLCVLHRFVI
jgi:S-adenosylmethionine:diacylglycerol 3-amino-3-carboxypropyl transferase